MLRYLVSAIGTAWYLAVRRPLSVIVTNPPIFAAMACHAYARLARVPLVLDSHPGAFGRQGDRLAGKVMWLHAWLCRRSALTLVTSEEWGEQVGAWGGTALVLHEAPQPASIAAGRDGAGAPRRTAAGASGVDPQPAGSAPVVLYAGRLGGDEPVAEVLAAARLLPEARFLVTGRRQDLPIELLEGVGPNVTLTGYLDHAAYGEAMARSDVVLALTLEPTSVMRAACEAVYARKLNVVSDWPLCRELFPASVHVANEAVPIAGGIVEALARRTELQDAISSAAAAQRARFETQLSRLEEALGLPWQQLRSSPCPTRL